ncbi:MAG TPA: hypothetical protein DEA63_03810 [Firmicutes bacterium]|nr:hypothetical protein [Bacillota bacterium]
MTLPKVGDVAEGVVVKVYPRYAILLFEDGWTGLLHISELANSFIHHFSGYVSTGNIYNVKVIAVNPESDNIRVSLKQMTSADRKKAFRRKKINLNEIDFKALEEKLPEWVKSENEKEINHD